MKKPKKTGTVNDFNIIFKSLNKARKEQKVKFNLTDSEYQEIQESIKVLQDLQQRVEYSSYTIFTRT